MPGLVLVTPPSVEPLSLQELKDHLRIRTATPVSTEDYGSEDRDLVRKLSAARRWVEQRTGRALLASVWRYWFDAFPRVGYLDLPKQPILSIASLTSHDTANAATVFSNSAYATDLIRGRLLLNDAYAWPTSVRRYQAGVVEFTAGYGTTAADVPPDLVEAVAEMTGYFYYDREGIDPVPQKVLDLVATYELVAV